MATTGTTITTRTGARTGTRTAKVVRGTSDATLYSFDVKQKKAIGALIDGTGKNFCTGTLVGDNVVLTAAHCVASVDPDNIRFAVGDDSSAPDRVFDVAVVRVNPLWDRQNPGHDNALLFLSESTKAYAAPLPINKQGVENLIGQQVQNVGYGATDPASPGGNTLRWWTAEPVAAVDGSSLVVDGRQVSSTCKGDSGAPSLFKFPDGQIRVVGTLFGGEATCIGIDKYARVDADSAWLLSGGGMLPLLQDMGQSFTLPYVNVPAKAGLTWVIVLPLMGLAMGMVLGRLAARRRR